MINRSGIEVLVDAEAELPVPGSAQYTDTAGAVRDACSRARRQLTQPSQASNTGRQHPCRSPTSRSTGCANRSTKCSSCYRTAVGTAQPYASECHYQLLNLLRAEHCVGLRVVAHRSIAAVHRRLPLGVPEVLVGCVDVPRRWSGRRRSRSPSNRAAVDRITQQTIADAVAIDA